MSNRFDNLSSEECWTIYIALGDCIKKSEQCGQWWIVRHCEALRKEINDLGISDLRMTKKSERDSQSNIVEFPK